MRRHTILGLLLLFLGLLNMIAKGLDMPLLSGLATASAASPAPKVFCSAKGLETFSTEFALSWRDMGGERHTMALDYNIYPRLAGPYNRRNVYGAILAFGPVLYTEEVARPMFDAVSHYGLCGQAPVLRELGLDPRQVRDVEVVYSPREGSAPDLPMRLKVECSR